MLEGVGGPADMGASDNNHLKGGESSGSMRYETLISTRLPAPVDAPAGLAADTKYVFSVTYADPDTVPSEGLSQAMGAAMLREGRDLAQYPPPQGHVGMRELIAQRLGERRDLSVGADSIFLSGGAGGAIQTILDALIDPGDIVLVEEFCYLGTLNALLGRRAQVVHVPMDDLGMDTDALDTIVKGLVSRGQRPKLIYTISVYQNPTGVTLSLDRRKHMLQIAQRYGIPVLENESYADFRIDGEQLPPSIMGMDDEDSVIYVSAYTKLLGCGLRLGYGVFPEPMRATLSHLKFGVSPSHLAAMTVHEYLRNHAEEYVADVAASLRVKRDAMLAALGENFPPTCSWNSPEGGMMVWVRLPEGADTLAALDRAVEADVKYNPGSVFRADRDRKNYLRLTFSHNTPEEIHEGIAVLAGVFEREGLWKGLG